MSLRKNYAKEINELLMKKRNAEDVAFTLSVPEHRFKRYGEKFNWALRSVYERYLDEGRDIMMFHILLSMQEFFDMDWVVGNVLNEENILVIREEMSTEYNVKELEPKGEESDEDDTTGE